MKCFPHSRNKREDKIEIFPASRRYKKNFLFISLIIIRSCLDLSPHISSSGTSGDVDDDFCPRMDEANMMILKQIGDHADDTAIYATTDSAVTAKVPANIDNDSDSDNELLPKNVLIPGPDDIDATIDDDFLGAQKRDDLVLTQSAEYKRKHFSNTSSESSDSDDSITRGLDFKNIPVTATIEPHTSPTTTSHDLLTNIQSSIARNLIENIVRPQPASSQKGFESDDSDFEILDSEEIPK
jgi:hypothetical protein